MRKLDSLCGIRKELSSILALFLKNNKEIERWKNFIVRNSNNQCLIEACKYGDRELVHLFIASFNHGFNPNWNDALHSATRGGHRELVDLFIAKGADDWDRVLCEASRRGMLCFGPVEHHLRPLWTLDLGLKERPR